MVIGTFSDNGPEKCSGLTISQYNEAQMEKLFSGNFERLDCKRVEHETPFQTSQEFLFCSFERKD
jgi:hypothetical protein